MEKDIRTQIIDSAKELFARFGFRKTTVDEIAQSLHKGKSSIYHYFKSKEEIFKEVIKKEYDFLKQSINQALVQQDSPKDKLQIYILTRLDVLSNLSNFYTALRNDYFECLGLIEGIRKQYVLEEIATIKIILQEGMDRGIFNIQHIEVTAQTIISVLKSLEYDWAMEEDKEELVENITNMLDMFFYGIMQR